MDATADTELKGERRQSCYLVGRIDKATLKVVDAQFASSPAIQLTTTREEQLFDVVSIEAKDYQTAQDDMIKMLHERPWVIYYGWLFPLLRAHGVKV